MTALRAVALVGALVASGLAGARWLRVAQREHYLAGSATRFALRWWLGFGPNRLLGAAALIGVVLSPLSPLSGLAAALAIAVGPFRLSLRGRAPGRLAWTPRLRRLATCLAVLLLAPVGAALAVGSTGAAVPVAALASLLTPLLVDLASALMAPVEDHLAGRFVEAARARLVQVAPTVVGITGSYGKTSAKAYVAHLCGTALRVVPTPASFNNRAGLARAINEQLVPGTEVFVAEMGTYGPGEIRDLCSWCPPDIAVITAIGPVHLERFATEDAIVAAKSEILEPAAAVVLNVDDPRLAALADAQAAVGRRVWRCSSLDGGVDVCARREGDRLVVTHAGRALVTVAEPAAAGGNVAVAVAVALELGVSDDVLAARLATLPSVANRQAVSSLTTGATVIDDTFNSNPAGCRRALAALARLGQPGAKRVVVTPGMVELGARQAAENTAFAAATAAVATHVIVVGWTNRRDLLAGLASAGAATGGAAAVAAMVVDRREEAVAWVRQHTVEGDAVLYENDLPDHYP